MAALVTGIAAGLGAWWWTVLAPPEVSRTQFALDTLVTITAGGSRAEAGVTRAFAEIARVERLLSSFEPGSEIARINAGAGRRPVRVNDETFRFVSDLVRFSRLSGGAFDPTVGPLVALWGFGGDHPAVPASRSIQSLLPLVGADKIKLDPARREVFLPLAGMQLDVGGALKGYAVDRAADALREAGVRYGLVDAGRSSIKVVGRRPWRRPWVVAIADPRREGAVLGWLRLRDGEALGTSADNTRFFIAGGVRYSHLLDPATGWPARHNRLVTVAAGSAFEADALSKLFVVPSPQVLSRFRRLGRQGLVLTSVGELRSNLAGFAPATREGKR